MLGNLHVRFGVGAGGQFPGPHHHLGAAYVLLTELNDLPDDPVERRQGFSRRLRAIGHLFEAYQADGTMPDWEALAGAGVQAGHMPEA